MIEFTFVRAGFEERCSLPDHAAAIDRARATSGTALVLKPDGTVLWPQVQCFTHVLNFSGTGTLCGMVLRKPRRGTRVGVITTNATGSMTEYSPNLTDTNDRCLLCDPSHSTDIPD